MGGGIGHGCYIHPPLVYSSHDSRKSNEGLCRGGYGYAGLGLGYDSRKSNEGYRVWAPISAQHIHTLTLTLVG